VAGLPPGSVTAFFDSLGRALGARIEIEVRSRTPQEAIAASFAGVGRALRAAGDARRPRRGEAVSRQ